MRKSTILHAFNARVHVGAAIPVASTVNDLSLEIRELASDTLDDFIR